MKPSISPCPQASRVQWWATTEVIIKLFLRLRRYKPESLNSMPWRDRIEDPHHFNADPDPSFIVNADPDPTFHFNTDQDMNQDLDPVPHKSDANLRPLSTDNPRLRFEPPRLYCERPWLFIVLCF